MKKLFFLSAVVGLAAFSANAGTIEMYSCNTVGVHKVSATSSDRVNVPVPFVAIGGGDIKLADVVYSDNIAVADYVMVSLNNKGAYNQWLWFGSLVEGGWYPTIQNDITPSAATVQELPRGTGVVVNHGNSKNNPIYVMGQYDPDAHPTSVVLKGNRSFLVNPTSQAFVLDTQLVSGTSPMDQVTIVRSGQEYTYRYSAVAKDQKHWYYRNETTNEAVYDSPTIAPGEGFWYNRHGAASGNRTIAW